MPDHITDDYDFAIDETTDSNDIRYSIEEDNYTFDFVKNGNEVYNNIDISNVKEGELKTKIYDRLTPYEWKLYHQKINHVLSNTYGKFERIDLINSKIVETSFDNHEEVVAIYEIDEDNEYLANFVVEEVNNGKYNQEQIQRFIEDMFGQGGFVRYSATDNTNVKSSKSEQNSRKFNEDSENSFRRGIENSSSKRNKKQGLNNSSFFVEEIKTDNKGYDFGDITKTGIQLGKNLVKTPENFKDGYDFGDITKTVGASALDIGAGTIKGMMNFGESTIADPLQYGVAQVSDWMGFDNFANAVRENAKQNGVEQTFAPIDKLTDRYTAIGTTGDQLSSGIGNVIAMGNMSGLLKAKGLPSSVNVGKFAIPTTSIASGIGSGMTEAYNNGASDGEAWTYGALSGLAEGFSESLFGGLGKKFNLNVGEGGLDDFLVKKFTDKISNNTIKILTESGLKATGEGVEEILSGIGSAVSKKLTYLSEKDLETLIKDENLAEQFIMGTLTSLISQTPGTIQSVKTGTDLITGQPTNNQPLTLENMQQNVPYTVKSNKGNVIAPLGNNALNTPVLNKNNQPYNVLNNGKEYAPYVPINNTFRYEKSTNPKINALNESMVKSNFIIQLNQNHYQKLQVQ